MNKLLILGSLFLTAAPALAQLDLEYQLQSPNNQRQLECQRIYDKAEYQATLSDLQPPHISRWYIVDGELLRWVAVSSDGECTSDWNHGSRAMAALNIEHQMVLMKILVKTEGDLLVKYSKQNGRVTREAFARRISY